MGNVFGKVKRLSGEDESSESDEDAKTTSAMNKNFKEDKFWNMPPLLKTYVVDIKKKEKLLKRDFKLDTQDRTLKGIYRGKEIMTDMNARFKIDISYSQAWRAKCYALQLLRGTPEESFAELPLYCHNLKLKNQGTITHIETDDEDRFEIFFSCRRCCAIAMDGNNQILPLAYGVGKSETFKSLDWIIPGPAGILQLAQLHKTSEIKEGGHNGEMSTQEYVRKITEEASEDDHFTCGPWLSAVQYLAAEGRIATGCFGDMKTFIRNGKLEKVVEVIKSCTPNMLGDLTVTLKDLSGIESTNSTM
nr:hypothetical protein [Tanacetum cinerariifolium]